MLAYYFYCSIPLGPPVKAWGHQQNLEANDVTHSSTLEVKSLKVGKNETHYQGNWEIPYVIWIYTYLQGKFPYLSTDLPTYLSISISMYLQGKWAFEQMIRIRVKVWQSNTKSQSFPPGNY